MTIADDITPTLQQISVLERTRTVTDAGVEVGTFSGLTRPTDTEVMELAAFAVGMFLKQPTWLQTQENVALMTCLLIEESFFRDNDGVARFTALLARQGYIVAQPGQFGGEPVEERNIDTVMLRPGFTEYDPWYAKPVPLANWPYDGNNT